MKNLLILATLGVFLLMSTAYGKSSKIEKALETFKSQYLSGSSSDHNRYGEIQKIKNFKREDFNNKELANETTWNREDIKIGKKAFKKYLKDMPWTDFLKKNEDKKKYENSIKVIEDGLEDETIMFATEDDEYFAVLDVEEEILYIIELDDFGS